METWQVILCMIAGVVAAALVPVLLQARRTLRAVEEFTRATQPRVELALAEVTAATARLNRTAEAIEKQAESMRPLLEGIADIGRSLKQARWIAGTVSAIGQAIGPALAAAVGSFLSREGAKDVAAEEPEVTPLRRPARGEGES